jgi:hypothetical protein
LQRGGVGESADHASEGINLMNQLALGGASNGWIAGLPGNPIKVQRKQRRRKP